LTKTSISDRTSPDSINANPAVKQQQARVGAWLFRHRTSLPVPIALAIVVWPADPAANPVMLWVGVGLTALGEAARLWGVHHIGTVSRTRTDRLGPLISTGPFAIVRNPLYLGNIALWVGFALVARLPWMALLAALLLGAEYHAIVRWEETLLEARLGEVYRRYAARVPRWIPKTSREASGTESQVLSPASSFTWPETLFSERGTLVAMAAGYLLLLLKARS
jgi:protein-S-isoprenylcysteine O-methyltransferase Ste14